MALSHRGRKALRTIGLEKDVLEIAIPMRGRLLHSLSGETKSVPYDNVSKQVSKRIFQNLVLLTIHFLVHLFNWEEFPQQQIITRYTL